MKLDKGFTLIEVLLAVFLSSIVIFLSYQFYNSISKTMNFVKRYNLSEQITIPLFILMLKDFESTNLKYGYPQISKNSISLYTENCYFFKGICKVSYWIYKEKKECYLIRSEYRINSISKEGIDIPLTDKVKEISSLNLAGNNLLKITLQLSGNQTLPLTFHLH